MMKKNLGITAFIFFYVFILNAQEVVSPFNKLKLQKNDSLGTYSFLVSGHFHGSSDNTTGLPAKTLLNNIDEINHTQADLIVSLGDLFLDVKNDIPDYTDTLFRHLEKPLFNAVGNHDLTGNIYQENFGSTFFYFHFHHDLFIILDTELDDGSITGEQQKMFEEALTEVRDSYHVFIFSHRLIWAEDHPDLKNLFRDNTRSSSPGNFRSYILPQLEKISVDVPVYWFGGSMGNVPAPFFFYREKEYAVTYIATAIRDTPKDAMLMINVNGKQISFDAFSLPMSPEYYNLDYYQPKEIKTPSFNWRLLPLYTKQAVSHRYFWYGVLFIALPFVVVFVLLRRKRRHRG